MSKEACVFVIDVGKSMGNIVQGTLNGLDKAKKAVSLFIQQKLLFTKQDELGIVVVGSEDTANPLNEEDPDNYRHVKVIQDIQRPAVDFLQKIDEIDVEDASGDVIDGLLVAMAMIKSRVGKLKFSKRIFLITDGASDIVDDPAAMETICDGLNNDEFRLNIVGIDFQEDEEDEEDEKKVKQEHKEDSHRTRVQIANEKLLRDLADKVGGAVFTAKGAVSMLSMFRSRSVNQVTLFRGNLEIGEHLNLSVYSYGKTMMMNMPSLKKMSVPASEAAEPDTMAVKMERSYWNKKAETETAVDREEMIKAFRYGKEQIPFSDEDMANLKYQCDKGLQVIGFTPTSKVKRHEYMGKVDCIVSEPGNKKSALALSALIHALLETDHVAVVRYVKRQNATPKLGILIPEVTSEYECLYFNQLPFAEDVRDFSFASLTENPKNVPNDRQLAAVRDLVNSLDLMKGDDDGYVVEALQPELTFNPVLQRFYQCVEKRALDPSAPISDLDPAIAKYVNPDPNMIKAAAPAYKKLKEQFHLVKVETKDKSEKRHWRDYFDVGAVDADLEQLKRARVDADEKHGGGDVDMKFSDIVTRHADKVGAVNPVEDFKSMISRRDDPTIVKRAIEEMQSIIKTIVVKSYGDSQFPQALNCVIALRDGCVENEEAELFNKGLKELREATKKKEAFWKMMAENSVFPIDRTEVGDSTYTREEAHAFYAGAPSTSATSATSVNISEDDLFESMD